MHLKRQVVVNAPAEQVWKVIAHDFAQIDRWASAVARSTAVTGSSVSTDAEISGRTCLVPGFGQIQENIIYYDEQNRRFGYAADGVLPFLVKRVESHCSVQPQGPDRSVLVLRPEFELRSLLGLLVAPIMRWRVWLTKR